MAKVGRPRKPEHEKNRQFNVKLPPDVIDFLNTRDNKSKTIIDAIRKAHKLRNKRSK